ncbi:MAG: hypothetical protein AAF468_13245 [Pseudomonadota bacterium]
MNHADRLMPALLLTISAILAIWGAAGLIEYFVPSAMFRLQNEKFPPGLQFLHFLSILIAGSVFIIGYIRRWPPTPFVTVTMYAVMATLCFIETVDFEAFGGGHTRYIPMVAEFFAYFCFSAYLLRSQKMRQRFQ